LIYSLYLTKFELEYFYDNKDLLDELVKFFSKGGFNLYTNDKLILEWNDKFED
jgi:hypothetical protein